MSDLVERVARAMCVADCEDPDEKMPPHPLFRDVVTYRWQIYKPSARAAIDVALEEAAKVADECQRQNAGPREGFDENYRKGLEAGGQAIAAAIRAMKKDKS